LLNSLLLKAKNPVTEPDAAKSIQRFYRARREGQQRRATAREERAAFRIQRAARGALALARVTALRVAETTARVQRAETRSISLSEAISAECSALETFISSCEDMPTLTVKSALVLDPPFWLRLFRKGYTVSQRFGIVLVQSDLPAALDPVFLTTGRRRGMLDGCFSKADLGLLIDPRVVLLCIGGLPAREQIDAVSRGLGNIYGGFCEDACVLDCSKRIVDVLATPSGASLVQKLSEVSAICSKAPLTLIAQVGVRSLLRRCLEEAVGLPSLSSAEGSTPLVFALPYAHQQYDPQYPLFVDTMDLPVYGFVSQKHPEALRLSGVCERLGRLQWFTDMLSSSEAPHPPLAMTPNLQGAADHSSSPPVSLSLPAVSLLDPDSLMDQASQMHFCARACLATRMAASILRPDQMLFAPGCDIVRDWLGGMCCGYVELSHSITGRESPDSLISSIRPRYAYQAVKGEEAASVFQRLGAIVQSQPADAEVVGYVSYSFYTDRDGACVQVASYTEVPSPSYFPVAKLMSGCVLSPAEPSVAIPPHLPACFARAVSEAFEYSGFLTINLVVSQSEPPSRTSGRTGSAGPGRTMALTLNSVSYGITPRVLEAVLSRLSPEGEASSLLMPNLSSCWFEDAHSGRFSPEECQIVPTVLAKLGADVADCISASPATPQSWRVSIRGSDARHTVFIANRLLSRLQNETKTGEKMREIIAEGKGEEYAQREFEQMGTIPFYVCGVNLLLRELKER